jgi:hypothetical protein
MISSSCHGGELYRRIEDRMKIKRILAGSIVALLMSVSALAAACDLSCAFASMSSDCHSGQSQTLNSESRGMKMDGMAMAGMAMPQMASSAEQQSVSATDHTSNSHPSIGDMGPCERQSCNGETAIAARASHSVPSSFQLAAVVAVARCVDLSPPDFHDARQHLAADFSRSASPFPLSLRI